MTGTSTPGAWGSLRSVLTKMASGSRRASTTYSASWMVRLFLSSHASTISGATDTTARGPVCEHRHQPRRLLVVNDSSKNIAAEHLGDFEVRVLHRPKLRLVVGAFAA